MKPSELPKDKRDSIRINTLVDEALREDGLSVQKLLDWAIDQRVNLSLDIKVKKPKREK